jgi:hypothetical protein
MFVAVLEIKNDGYAERKGDPMDQLATESVTPQSGHQY